MAMGNFCYIQSIECPYATALGTCRDDIYSDFNKCEVCKSTRTLGSPLHLLKMWGNSAENKSVLPVLQSKNVRVKVGG